MRRLATCGSLVLALCAYETVGAGQTAPSVRPPVFTAAQAATGSTAYKQHCASCHGAQLEGQHLAPALTGERFDRTWGGKSAEALMFQLRRMPPQLNGQTATATRGATLNDDTYAALLAFLLQANGVQAGQAPLTSDGKALAALTIPARAVAATADVDAPSAGANRNSTRLARLSPVTEAMLSQPPDGDWLQWGRSYDGQNYSPLKAITRRNVSELRPAWRTSLRAGTSMPTPIVHDGVLFLQTIPDTVLALDGASGDILWRYQHKLAGPANKKMGLALHGDRIFVATSDLHVIGLNAKTGALIWDQAIAADAPKEGRGQLQMRSAPLIVKDKLIQGVTSSFTPGGGFIVALDLNSGRELWRFYTIARPGEPGGETWNGLPLEKRSGGSVWHQGTYDAELNLIYFGAAPTYDTGLLLHPSGAAGVTSDALYTNCTIALNPDTGKLVWYFQHVPNDQWDLDWVFERQIVTMTIAGQRRKVILNVGKMAILDVLDAATGEYLFSIDSGTQNIITHIDPKTGAKTIDRSKWPDPNRPAIICPGVSGARAWPPTSYSPSSTFLYLPLTEWCNTFGSEGSKLLTSGVGLSSAEHPASADGMMGRVQALDVNGRKAAWVHRQPSPISTSMLATAGGVVFAGDLDPALKALDDTTGQVLWTAKLDDLPSGSIVTYRIGGTQYVAVVVGLRNNHVSDLSRTYNAFRKRHGQPNVEAPTGGAAIWVFKR